MQKIKAIKFATSVPVGNTQELFINEKKGADVFFDTLTSRYVIIDHKTQTETWVHITNVSWARPFGITKDQAVDASDKSTSSRRSSRAS